jgi:HrpA-like RNA helicase
MTPSRTPGQWTAKVSHAVNKQVDYMDSALLTTLQLHVEKPVGDILLFLTGTLGLQTLSRRCLSFLPLPSPPLPIWSHQAKRRLNT